MKRKSIVALMLAVFLVGLASSSSTVSACHLRWGPKNMWVIAPKIEITATGPFRLDEPNTVYKLTVDLTVPENDFYGFTIEADNVVLDLMGHTIKGDEWYFGVYVKEGYKDITIAYGTLYGFLKEIVVFNSENVNIKFVDTPPCGILYVRPSSWLQIAFMRAWLAEL